VRERDQIIWKDGKREKKRERRERGREREKERERERERERKREREKGMTATLMSEKGDRFEVVRAGILGRSLDKTWGSIISFLPGATRSYLV
jgi:hypothetical protein